MRRHLGAYLVSITTHEIEQIFFISGVENVLTGDFSAYSDMF